MSPAEGLYAILNDLGVLGGVTGWTGEIGALRDAAKTIAFIDTGGRGGEAKVAIDYPTVQLLIMGDRAAGGYSAGYTKALAAYAALQGIEQPNAYPNLVSCLAMGGIQWLGKDEKDRPRWSLNFRLITTPDDEGNRTY